MSVRTTDQDRADAEAGVGDTAYQAPAQWPEIALPDTDGPWVSDVQLAEHYNVSRSTIWRWSGAGIIDEPVKFSPGCARWNFAKIKQRDAERAAQQAARRT